MAGIVFAALLVGLQGNVVAQSDLGIRFGGGFEFAANPFNRNLSTSLMASGFTLRLSKPVTKRVSLAVGGSAVRFMYTGSAVIDTYAFPQVSLIITRPSAPRAPYLMGGVGLLVPFSTRAGVVREYSLHAGVGWARRMRDYSAFIEVNPAIIRNEGILNILVPLRVGFIF